MESTNQDPASRAPTHAPATPPAEKSEKGSQSQKLPQSQVEADALADVIELEGPKITTKSLRDLITAIPDIRVMVVATAVRCLGAQRMMGGGKKGEVERCEDGATQMKAVAFLAAYSDGLPVQTTMNLNVDGNRDMPIEEMLVKSPALVAAMEKQLARAKSVQKTGGQKQVGPGSEKPAAGAQS